MKRVCFLALALCWLAASGPSFAATQSVSYSTWTISGNTVNLRFVMPAAEAERLNGADLAVVTTQRVGAYLLRNVGVQAASGECAVMDQGYDLGKIDPLDVGPGRYGFEIFFHCADPRDRVLRNTALFARDGDHVNIARIYLDGSLSVHLFTASEQRLAVPDKGTLTSPSLPFYIGLGAEHLFDSVDRLCVLLGLALLAARRRDLGYIVGALALGYALSAVVSHMGWVAPRLSLIDAFVAFLVALCGVAIAVRNTERHRAIVVGWSSLLLLAAAVCAFARLPEALLLLGAAAFSGGLLTLGERRDRVAWPLLAGVLGFLDGFVWSAAIGPAELPGTEGLKMTVGLDAGALLVELALIGLIVGAFRWAAGRKLDVARPLINDVCAALLSGFGAYWLVLRLFA